MPILEDVAAAIANYANTYVKLDIVEMKLDTNAGNVWNIRDTGSFKVRVRNTGNLDVKKMALHITGSPYGQVQVSHTSRPLPPMPYVDWFYTPEFDIDAHTEKVIGPPFNFGFQATRVTPGTPAPLPAPVISATVAKFDVTLDHLLVDHTGYSATTKVTEDIAILAA